MGSSKTPLQPSAVPQVEALVCPNAAQVLRQLDDEDPAFADAMRRMLSFSYREAGRPLGADEAGMCAWWASGTGTTVQ